MDDEFPPGRCVDCGMSVPFQDIICDICKNQWQVYQNLGPTIHEPKVADSTQLQQMRLTEEETN